MDKSRKGCDKHHIMDMAVFTDTSHTIALKIANRKSYAKDCLSKSFDNVDIFVADLSFFGPSAREPMPDSILPIKNAPQQSIQMDAAQPSFLPYRDAGSSASLHFSAGPVGLGAIGSRKSKYRGRSKWNTEFMIPVPVKPI
ncbi:MAG: hypothetical protein HZB23_03340 [Deltaproteobacteria bacterium]|nr:hypothetical protein [Deltaproteobacteria bacterium]